MGRYIAASCGLPWRRRPCLFTQHPSVGAFMTAVVYLPSIHLAWLWGHPADGHVSWSPPALSHSFLCMCCIPALECPLRPCSMSPGPCPMLSGQFLLLGLKTAGAASSGDLSPFLADLDPSLSCRQPCSPGRLAPFPHWALSS